jgi:WD40 repeat protein
MSADEATPDEAAPVDERCASLLAACHEALLAGESAAPLTGAEVPPELRARLERDLACVRLLDQARPEQAVTESADTPSSPDVQCATDLKSVRPVDHFPTTIGRFRIRRELGRGGYGIVFQAYDPQLGRDVALKIPRAEVVLSPELRERFLREARAAAGLDHPNLVPVFDAGQVGPVCYIASAYCPGTTLDAWLKARADPVPWQEAATLVATLAEAVHHAHAQGVVHRDLKPSNVLLQIADCRMQIGEQTDSQSAICNLQSAIPKITDFGLAKFHSLEPGATALQYQTQSGAIVGTPRYMAPEQAVGSSQTVGPPADIHALGAILYEVLTGRPPFVADTVLDTLEQVRSFEPVPPRRLRPRLPRDLETICLRCLQKEPGKRFTSAGELGQDLRRLLAGEPIRARPVGTWERLVKWARRRPAAAALVAVTSLASVLLVTGLVVGLVVITGALQREQQTSYLKGITSAQHEISVGNWGRVDEFLEGCPERLRGWEWHHLKRLRHARPIPPLPMGERVSMTTGFDMAFHPDSRLLAVPSSERNSGEFRYSIRVWDTSSGREVFTIHGHKDRVLGVAFSPDGRRLASTSQDTKVMVWDVSAGLAKGELHEPLFTCPHEEPVIGVAFSPDGGRLASASALTKKAGTVKVWDAAGGKLLWRFPGQTLPNVFVHLAFSPNGDRLAAGGESDTVKVWDLTTGEAVRTLWGHTEAILNVTFSPDGRRLISGGWDRVVRVWDLDDPDASASQRDVLAPRWKFDNFSTGASAMALSPDGSRLAIGGPTGDGHVRIYDMSTGSLLLTLKGDYRVISVAFSADGGRLAAVGHDKVVRLWDTTTGDEVLSLRGHGDIVGHVLFSPNGQRLASVSADGTVRVWDASPIGASGDSHVRTLGGPDDGEFFGVAFHPTPDSPLVASASADRRIKLWNSRTGEVVQTFGGHKDRGHKEAALCVAFRPDGRQLLSGSMDRTVKLWDAETAEELPLPDMGAFKVMVRSVAFQPDGKAFATVSHQTVQRWEARTGRPLFDREADQEHGNWVAFSRDGKYLAAVGHSGTAKVWSVETGEEVCAFKGHKGSVFCVAFDPTGTYLASGDSDSNVKLWYRATGKEICTLARRADDPTVAGHSDYVFGATFSSDGKYLATASWKEVIVWDVSSLEKIKDRRTFDRLAGRILCVAFSPDGKRLAAASGYKGKGEIKIWDSTLWEN